MTSPLAIFRGWGGRVVVSCDKGGRVALLYPPHGASEADKQALRKWLDHGGRDINGVPGVSLGESIRQEAIGEAMEKERARCVNSGPKRHGVRAMTGDDYTQNDGGGQA